MPFNELTAAYAGRKSGESRRAKSKPEAVRNKQIHLAVTESELQMIDAKATKHNLSRVELVVRAVGEYKKGNP